MVRSRLLVIYRCVLGLTFAVPLVSCESIGSIRPSDKQTAECMAGILRETPSVEDVRTGVSYSIRAQRYQPVVMYRFTGADGLKASTEIAVGKNVSGASAYWLDEARGVGVGVVQAWGTNCMVYGGGFVGLSTPP